MKMKQDVEDRGGVGGARAEDEEGRPEERSPLQPQAADLLGKALAEHFGVEAAKSARYQLYQLYAASMRARHIRP